MFTLDLSRARWRMSSYTQGNGACVEVARGEQAVGVRDSKHRTGPALLVQPAAFTALLGVVKHR